MIDLPIFRNGRFLDQIWMPSQFRGDGDEESREVWAVAFVAAAVISMFSTCRKPRSRSGLPR